MSFLLVESRAEPRRINQFPVVNLDRPNILVPNVSHEANERPTDYSFAGSIWQTAFTVDHLYWHFKIR